MAYERKHNRGSVFEIDNKTGKLILSGRINIQEWKRDQKDEYDPRTVVLRTESANGDPRLEVYVQLGVLFPADDNKKYAYSGPCGTGKIFAYAEETAEKKRFLNLSIADDAQPTRQEEPAASNEPIDDDVPF